MRRMITAVVLAASPTSTAAQVTAEDYARAERLLSWNAERLVAGDQVHPVWLDDDRFWYRNRLHDEAHEFILVDPNRGTRERAFDHERLAAVLSAAADRRHGATGLPFQGFEFVQEGRGIRFDVPRSGRWTCDIVAYRCAGPEPTPASRSGERASPDGRWVAFVRDHNIWIRSVQDGQEVRLSRDGEEHFGYGTYSETVDLISRRRTGRAEPPAVAWSPDSRRIVVRRLDERNLRRFDLWETSPSGPVHHSYPYAVPGDLTIPRFQLYIFDIHTREHVQVATGMQDMEWEVEITWDDPGPRSSWRQASAGPVSPPPARIVAWTPDGRELVLVRGHRGYQRYDVLAADPRTGAVRELFTETAPTFLRLLAWRVANGGRDLIWISQRDGWAHLYRFDLSTGKLRNRITSGTGNVLDIVRLDEDKGWIYFTAVGLEGNRDPYFRHLYRARMDGSRRELLTAEAADHQVEFSPSGRFFVNTYSRRDTVPVTVVRTADGRVVQRVQEADISPLLAAGWRWPVPFKVKGRDGKTDVYGLLHFPPDMRPDRKYPVIDITYPGPQTGPIGWRNFTNSPYHGVHALAELGFIVFTVDATGTPFRSKAFNEAWYGDMGDNGLPDHIAALRRLAETYPQIDLDRVGITGSSGGGFASTAALLRYPDFFKVAVSVNGNHDNRLHRYTWAERWQGLLTHNADGGHNYESQGNPAIAGNLRGKLLLMYGTLDDRVHPVATLLLADELIRHNKDFDIIVLPNRDHGGGGDPYAIRRGWDFFVRHLMGREPPREYRIRGPG